MRRILIDVIKWDDGKFFRESFDDEALLEG